MGAVVVDEAVLGVPLVRTVLSADGTITDPDTESALGVALAALVGAAARA